MVSQETTAVSADRQAEIADRIRSMMPQVRSDLEALTRIPSVSLDSFDQRHVDESAEAVAALLRAEGLEVRVVREGGRPAVIAHRDGPPGSPTVTLYAHHDVQPPGDDQDWDTPPFEPTERDGRLYGRGAADDKAGVMAHIAALRAHGSDLPVSVNVFVEGEEEIASDSLPAILAKYGDDLAADAIVLADSQNWDIGTPALTTALRGIVRAVVTVRTLQHSVHSGMFGGPLPDAITALAHLLGRLHDEQGDVAVPGLAVDSVADLDYDEQRLRSESGALPTTRLIGSGSILQRMWGKPTMTVIGIDAPTIETASNTLVAKARAKLSMRIAPSQDPQAAWEALRDYVLAQDVWGAQIEIDLEETGPGFTAAADGPIYDAARDAFTAAWDGTPPVDIGVGGSIPFVAAFAQRFPQAAILVTGVEDPDTRAHGANESLHLAEFERVCIAEALLLEQVAAHERSH